MKYLKKYEESIKYNIGDYVLLNKSILTDIDTTKIIDIDLIPDHGIYGLITDYQEKYTYPYDVEIYRDKIFINNNEILRHLTPNEIQTYKTYKKSVKYNI